MTGMCEYCKIMPWFYVCRECGSSAPIGAIHPSCLIDKKISLSFWNGEKFLEEKEMLEWLKQLAT